MSFVDPLARSPRLLLVNQTIGPLFMGVVAAAARRGSVTVMAGETSLPFPARVLCLGGMTYHRTPALRRLFTWLGFSLHLSWHLLRQGRSYEHLLLVSNPPMAPLLAPLAGRPYALLLYDLYPQVLQQLRPRGPARWALEALSGLWNAANRRLFAGAERVFTLSEAMAAALRPSFASADQWRRTVVVIPPWAENTALQPRPEAAQDFRARHGLDQRLLVSYSGNLGLTHPLEPLLEAAARLQAAGAPAPAQMVLIGHGPKRAALQRRARSLALAPTSLRFLEPVPFAELAASLSAADLAVVALDGPAAAASLPSKMFSALACATPLLALAPAMSAVAQVVQQHRCGLLIEPGLDAATQLADAISALAADPGRLQQLAANALVASRQYTPANAERLIELWLDRSA